MKVLLMNASPKADGATQEILLTVKSALPQGYETEMLCLGDVKIGFCLGEKTCYETGRCILDDDMNTVMNLIDAADALVIAAPSYWADVPAQFKAFIDRCTVYGDTNPNPTRRTLKPGKKCYAAALRAGTRTTECEHIIETIAHWCGHMQIEPAGSMFFCGISDKLDTEKHKPEIISKTKSWFSE